MTGRVAKCNTPCQNGELRNTICHFDLPAGGVLNAKGVQGRPLSQFPRQVFVHFSGLLLFCDSPYDMCSRVNDTLIVDHKVKKFVDIYMPDNKEGFCVL